MVLALFVPEDVAQSVASSNPRISVGSESALVVISTSLAGAAEPGPALHAARPIARGVIAPRSATVVVFVFVLVLPGFRMMFLFSFVAAGTPLPGMAGAYARAGAPFLALGPLESIPSQFFEGRLIFLSPVRECV